MHPPTARAVAAVALLVLVSGCARLGGEVLQGSHNVALPLATGETLGQTFATVGDQLVGVDLETATYSRDLDGTLRVELRDAADGRVLATAEVPGEDVADNGWTPVRFDEPVAAPERARVEVAWDGADPVGLYGNVPDRPRPALEVQAPGAADAAPLVNDPYPGGTLERDGAPAGGDLAFRVVGRPGAAGVARTVGAVLGGLAAGAAQQPVATLLWVAALAGCVTLALRGLRGPGLAGDGRNGRTGQAPAGAAGQLDQGRPHQQGRHGDERRPQQPLEP